MHQRRRFVTHHAAIASSSSPSSSQRRHGHRQFATMPHEGGSNSISNSNNGNSGVNGITTASSGSANTSTSSGSSGNSNGIREILIVGVVGIYILAAIVLHSTYASNIRELQQQQHGPMRVLHAHRERARANVFRPAAHKNLKNIAAEGTQELQPHLYKKVDEMVHEKGKESEKVPTTAPAPQPSLNNTIFSKLRSDRSGASIHDMFFAHAYAFRHNLTYGGSCGPDLFNRSPDVRSLLSKMGLQTLLPVAACPSDTPSTNDTSVFPRIVPQQDYYANDTHIWTPEYVEHLGKTMKALGIEIKNKTDDDRKTIVVHVRRGDVEPCTAKDGMRYRYSPNAYVLSLIDTYVKELKGTSQEDPHVVIFSESKSHEPWDEFKERGYELRLDGPIEDVWMSMLFESDVMILGKSSFSLIPALLRSAMNAATGSKTRKVVYTPMWHAPLSDWEMADWDLVGQSNKESNRLFHECHSFAHHRIPVFFSRARLDRSGASIQDMLLAHAYAFHTKTVYGGACGKDEFHRKATVTSLVEKMGLREMLPVRCPMTADGKIIIPFETKDSGVIPRTIPHSEYASSDTKIWTPNYLAYLGKAMKQQGAKMKPSPDGRKTIVVHIRRGDVDPCIDYGLRYVPNSHYLTLIDKYVKKLEAEAALETLKIGSKSRAPPLKPRVIIYSEAKSTESLDVFRQKGYEMRLDGPLEDVWMSMAFESDVTILAKSSFSIVPAMLRTALSTANGRKDHSRIVYTPMWHQPLEGWDVVDDQELLERTKKEAAEMHSKCPKTK